MEGLFLCILILMEVGLCVFTITKQREKALWVRNRFAVDGAELVLYLLMTLLPGIDFSFRYKLIFVVLIIRLIVSAICFAVQRKKSGTKKIMGCIIGTFFTALFLAVSLIPAFIFTDYEGLDTTGKYDVAMSQVILVDQSREEAFENDGSKREVPAHFYYPANGQKGEKYPIVIFSHGAFGYYQSNTSTYMELASNGYVVMSLDHPYHSFFSTDTTGKTITVNPEFINQVMVINQDGTSEEEICKLSHEWLTIREADMNFVLDTMKASCTNNELPTDTWFLDNTKESTIKDILAITDTDKIGLMGHSLGGASSVALGRERSDISAVIDLDGTMLSEETSYENGKYIMIEEAYPTPVLSIDSESHHKDAKLAGSYYVNNVVLDNAVDGQRTYVKGTEHMNFTDLPLFAPSLAKALGTGNIDATHCINEVNDIVLQYMNAYLKGEGNFTVQECYE